MFLSFSNEKETEGQEGSGSSRDRDTAAVFCFFLLDVRVAGIGYARSIFNVSMILIATKISDIEN